jgi:hypothetical protein
MCDKSGIRPEVFLSFADNDSLRADLKVGRRLCEWASAKGRRIVLESAAIGETISFSRHNL